MRRIEKIKAFSDIVVNTCTVCASLMKACLQTNIQYKDEKLYSFYSKKGEPLQ